MSSRIEYLDGHRGLAILSVVLFHAYARWSDIVPYGEEYKNAFKFGWLGVQLFFLISGFVILMTLEKCKNFEDFLYRRWLRLFPAMLICSLIIFATGPIFNERPAGPVTATGLIPGLLFIEPSWFKHIFGLNISPLEGAFWSLYVEFKFYVIAGLLYFFTGRLKLIVILIIMSALAHFSQIISSQNNYSIFLPLSKLTYALSFQHFGWFAGGAAAYCYLKTKDNKWLLFAISIITYCSITIGVGNYVSSIYAALIGTIFILSLKINWLQRILNHPIFQFFGYVSYPLYLLHENIMIASIVIIGQLDLPVPQFTIPLLPISLLSATAFVVAKYGEPFIKKWLPPKSYFNLTTNKNTE